MYSVVDVTDHCITSGKGGDFHLVFLLLKFAAPYHLILVVIMEHGEYP